MWKAVGAEADATQNSGEIFCHISAKSLPKCADSEHMLVDTSGQKEGSGVIDTNNVNTCGIMIKPHKHEVYEAENLEPPAGFEPATYALRKQPTNLVTANNERTLQEITSSLLPYFCQTQSADLDLLKQICTVWSLLPKHIKATIKTLIKSCT